MSEQTTQTILTASKPTYQDTYDERHMHIEMDTSIPSLFDDPEDNEYEDEE